MNRRDFCGLVAGAASTLGAGALALPAWAQDTYGKDFFFKNGDRVVMIGDSITEQHLHSNYVESFVVSRFPDWQFAFRNTGIGGDTSTGGASRTERDILAFKPTAVTITFGMNDAGYVYPYNPDRLAAYRKGLQTMLDKIRPTAARVAILSPSPVEKREDGRALEGYNQTLELFSAWAKNVAVKNNAMFVDQIHPHLAVLQKARDAKPSNRINGGDAVHPGPSGQILMAWAILKGLGAPTVVSTASISASSGEVGDRENCRLYDVRVHKNGLSFTRKDEAVPFWIPVEARSILDWAPVVQDLDQYTLQVVNLPEGRYNLVIDGEKVTTLGSADLERGYNLALLTDGPIAKQAKAVNDAVFAKNRYYHDQIFRGVVLNGMVAADQKEAMIAERMKGMPALEKAIRDALVLKSHKWEVVKA